MSRPKNLLSIISATALALLATYVLFWNLGNHSISLRSDEVIYVRVSQPVLKDNAWFPLLHGKIPFFEKPPLKLWLGALFPAILGESTFSYRLIDALFGVCILLLTIWLSYQIFRSHLYGVVAGILMLGAFEFTASHHGLRRAVLDSLIVALAIASAIISYTATIRGPREPISKRETLLIGFLCGLGVLTKSVAGLLPIVWLCAFLLFQVRWKEIFRVLVFALLPALFMGALYYVPVCLEFSRASETLFGAELFTRVFEGIEGHNTGDPFYYYRFLLVGGILPPVLLCFGTATALTLAWKDGRFLFLGIWAYGPVILFSLSSSKVPWYLHPSVPFLALLCVAALCEVSKSVRARYPVPTRNDSAEIAADREKSRNFFAQVWQHTIAAACCIVVAISGFQYYRLLRRVVNTVAQQTNRVDVELLVEHIQEHSINKVVIVDSALSFRSNPKKGRFNVEGFYINFIRDRIVQVTGEELQTSPGLISDGILVIPTVAVSTVPAGENKRAEIPPFGQRFESVTVLSYGTATLPELPSRKELP